MSRVRTRLGRIPAALIVITIAAAAAGFAFLRFGAFPNVTDSVRQQTACGTSIKGVRIDRASVIRVVPKVPAYTQGLIFADGKLYESTGMRGHSAIYRLDPRDGTRTKLFKLERELFGEGLARFAQKFYQLTWQAGLAFVYDQDDTGQHLVRTATFHRDGEGWGLTDLDAQLVLSDGSDELSFIDPKTFAVIRKVQVRVGSEPLPSLNELESVRGTILANIYGDSSIVGVNPVSGCVTTVIDASRLVAGIAAELESVPNPICYGQCSSWDFVLNGIAYDAKTTEIYVTGKNWPEIFVYRGLID